MYTICKDCEGTGKLGFQREDCWFCGGRGYVDDLADKNIKIDSTMIRPSKDIKDVRYKGDLDKYFKEVKECDITNDIVMILSDMYDLIKK